MKKITSLIAWVLGLQASGYLMGRITADNIDSWYTALQKSSLTPPNYIFGLVWGVLYVVLAVIGWQLFHNKKAANITLLRTLFLSQLFLNLLWTPIFFGLHWVGLALICLVGIVLLTTSLLWLLMSELTFLFWLTVPYWLWVSFAGYLNFVIFFSK